MGQKISCVCGNTKANVNVTMKFYTPKQQIQQHSMQVEDGDREIGHGITVNDLANGITNINSVIRNPIGPGWSTAPFSDHIRYEASMCERCYENLKPQLDDENSVWEDVKVKINKEGFYRSQLP